MSVFDAVKGTAGRLAGDVQLSLRRARLEGERRVLQRQHRSALEALGARAYELTTGEGLSAGALAAEVAAVEAKLMEIDAKTAEIAALRASDEADPERAETGSDPAANGDGDASGS